VRLLAFGAHPDDVELGVGALLARHVRLGDRVTICDLTGGEMSTCGDPEGRAAEAQAAARALGVSDRVCLGLPDLGIGRDPKEVGALVRVLRQCRPAVVLAPLPDDPHPDHGACSRLAAEACYAAGLARVEPDLAPHRVRFLFHYAIAPGPTPSPSLIIDVTSDYPAKRRALACHASQFTPRPGGPRTPLNDGTYLGHIEARDRYFGSISGCELAEPLWLRGAVRLSSLHPVIRSGGGGG